MTTITLHTINGYWKDDKTPIGEVIVSDKEETNLLDNCGYTPYTDDDIWYYGLDERLIKEAIELGENTVHEFVITDYQFHQQIEVESKKDDTLNAILGHFFTQYPYDTDPFRVLELLRESELGELPDGMILWEHYEDWDTTLIHDHINGIFNSIIDVWSDEN